jgi:hypothetical protein
MATVTRPGGNPDRATPVPALIARYAEDGPARFWAEAGVTLAQLRSWDAALRSRTPQP